MSSKAHEQLVKLGKRYDALKKRTDEIEGQTHHLCEIINEQREQIKYKDGQIDALKYAVNTLAKCAYWPEPPK